VWSCICDLYFKNIKRPQDFGYIYGVNEHHMIANALDNLVALCSGCHSRAELMPLFVLEPEQGEMGLGGT